MPLNTSQFLGACIIQLWQCFTWGAPLYQGSHCKIHLHQYLDMHRETRSSVVRRRIDGQPGKGVVPLQNIPEYICCEVWIQGVIIQRVRLLLEEIIGTLLYGWRMNVKSRLEESRTHFLQMSARWPEPFGERSSPGSGYVVSESKGLLKRLRSFLRVIAAKFIPSIKAPILERRMTTRHSHTGWTGTGTGLPARRILRRRTRWRVRPVEDGVDVGHRMAFLVERWQNVLFWEIWDQGVYRILLASDLRRLSCRRSWENQDVRARGILRCAQVTRIAAASEVLVRTELVRHDPQGGVCFQGHQASAEDARRVLRAHEHAHLADLPQMFAGT